MCCSSFLSCSCDHLSTIYFSFISQFASLIFTILFFLCSKMAYKIFTGATDKIAVANPLLRKAIVVIFILLFAATASYYYNNSGEQKGDVRKRRALPSATLESTNTVEDHSVPWYRRKVNWQLKPLTSEQNTYVTNLINSQRFYQRILPYLLSQRTPGSYGSRYVRSSLKSLLNGQLGWTVQEDPFYAWPPRPFRITQFTNVIATYNPVAPRRLVLACHYDSKRTPVNFVGAIDAAVPCAMMIEIAYALRHVLGQSPYKNELTLQLIFFDGEESFSKWSPYDSLYGSRYLADKWQRTPYPIANNSYGQAANHLDSIDLLTVLDLLGASNPRFYNSEIVKSKHFDALERIERSLYGKNEYFQDLTVNSYVEDDHVPFFIRNVSVLHVIPDPFPPQWHKSTDNKENLDPISIDRLTKIFAVFVSEYLHLNIPVLLERPFG